MVKKKVDEWSEMLMRMKPSREGFSVESVREDR